MVTGRGVVQISAYIDNLLASLLPTGAVAALNYAQILYLLPVSLFGMSVAAAELPGMSRATGTQDEVGRCLRSRLNVGLRQIAFFVDPLGGRVFIFGRRDCRGDFPVGPFHPLRRGVCMGNPGGIGGGVAGRHDGPALFVGLLRAVGYPHAA